MRGESEIRAKRAELAARVVADRDAGALAKSTGAHGPAADLRLSAAWGAQTVAALVWVLGEIDDPLFRVRI